MGTRQTDTAVHAGREQHKTPLTGATHTLDAISHRSAPSAYVLDSLQETRALKQLGTLGGGNHFLEVPVPPSQCFLSPMTRHTGELCV